MDASTREDGDIVLVKASHLPFEQLPNLPKAVVPRIDLGISRDDVLAIQPVSLSSKRKVGYFLADRSTQTSSSEILEVKRITSIIETLTQDVAQLRKDLNFAHHVMRQDYESRLNDRATELYCRVNERLAELEKHHKEKIEIVRRSYRTQLNNAIQKISGEYKAYYDELMQGKTGRHDLKIKELKERLALQEAELLEQSQASEILKMKVQQYEEELGERAELDAPPPPPPPGLSLEEGAELQATIDQLEGEMGELKAELAGKEEAQRKLSRQVDSLSRQLEEERVKVAHLKRDMDSQKKKAKAEQEKAQRMAENQLASMQKQMKETMENAQRDAARKAEEQAEVQRMRDQARFQEELARRQATEDKLRAEQSMAGEPPPNMEGDELLTQLEKLQKTEAKQREEIQRLSRELERSNRTWEMKLAVMQRNFHAMRDECFLRQSLQRQSASLHHATVGYAVSGKHTTGRKLKPLPQIQTGRADSTNGFLSSTNGNSPHTLTPSPITPTKLHPSHPDHFPAPPSPSPLHTARESQQSSPATRSVRFSHGSGGAPSLLPPASTSPPAMEGHQN